MPEKTLNQKLKQFNRQKIFHCLMQEGPCTKQELVSRLGLSLPTINQNLSELAGLIRESGSVGNTGGRRAKLYEIDDQSRLAVGLDITRTCITAVLVDLSGTVVHTERLPYPFVLGEAYARALADLVASSLSAVGAAPEQILGVGIAVPGLVTEDRKRIYYGKILNFTGRTVEDFSRFLPYPVTLENDANAAGFAEVWSCKNLGNAFYISLCNNIGGSVLIRNEIYTGIHQRAGEIGHMTIVPDGRVCYCGKRGCFETYCAATILSDLAGGSLSGFFSLLKSGNLRASAVWQEYLQALAIAVNNIHMLFDCDVILGGYVGAYMEPYLPELQKLAADRNTFASDAAYIRVCRYQTEAPAAGAALPYIDRFRKSL